MQIKLYLVIIYFAANNYDKLITALSGTLRSLGPQARPYVEKLSFDVKNTQHAVERGLTSATIAALENFEKDTRAGAGHTKSNRALFYLFNVVFPEQLLQMWSLLGVGERNMNHVTDLMGKMADSIEKKNWT